ncbi:DUF3419 family protein [Parapedobacter sp.]
MANLEQKVDFSIIRYANCWEDPNVLLRGLAPKEGAKILSIASAGDNSFSLLTADPALVVAVDINQTQLYLVELKKTAIEYLDYEDALVFLGFRSGTDRRVLFNQIKAALETDVRQYWERHTDAIARGIVHEGKFERYFRHFAHRVLPLIHSRQQVERLFVPKEEKEQIRFYSQHWNTWRWRLFFRIFFSRWVMGRLGRDPQFLKEVGVNVSSHIFQKAEQHLKKTTAQQNPILRYNLTGNYGPLLPHYLQPAPFKQVKANLERLVVRQGFAERIATAYGPFDAMNLSNIFEYMDTHIFEATARKLIKLLAEGGKMGYWNLMVPRRISTVFQEVRYLGNLSNTLTNEDLGFFYNQFIVEQK